MRTRTVALISSSTPFLQAAVTALTFEGHDALTFGTLPEAITYAAKKTLDAVVIDVSDRPARNHAALTDIVRIVGKDRIWMALPLGMSPWTTDAEQLGIRHTLKVPLRTSELEEVLADLQDMPDVIESNPAAEGRPYHIEDIANNRYFLAASPAMMRIYANVRLLAEVDAPVLILGESGVGKDVIVPFLLSQLRRITARPAGKRTLRIRGGSFYRSQQSETRQI